MDFATIETFITSVGFPIAMCLLLFYYMQKSDEKHEEEIKSLTATITANTQVLTELTTMIKTFIDKED